MNKNTALPSQSVLTNLGRPAVYDSGAPARHASGPAQVLVFWHSILADHHNYDAQVAALRDHHRLILIDGPAHGASGAAGGGFSMA